MLAHSVVAAVSDRRRRSEIDAIIRARRERRYGICAGTYVVLYRKTLKCRDIRISCLESAKAVKQPCGSIRGGPWWLAWVVALRSGQRNVKTQGYPDKLFRMSPDGRSGLPVQWPVVLGGCGRNLDPRSAEVQGEADCTEGRVWDARCCRNQASVLTLDAPSFSINRR